MENHPIPQDVTGFQFKLIGEMSVKQFAYLCGGIILAWIFLSSGIFVLLRIPLAFLTFLTGFLFAFVPFEGRPMDLMLAHFGKALFKPNQFVYQPTQPAEISSVPAQSSVQAPSQTGLQSAPIQTPPLFQTTPVASAPAAKLNQTVSMPTLQVIPTNPQEEKIKEELEQEKKHLQQELAEVERIKKEKQSQTVTPADVDQKIGELERELQDSLSHKQQLENELGALRRRFDSKSQQVFQPGTAADKPQSQTVKKVPQNMAKSLGLPVISDAPNVLIGIIKDPRGNVLPNMLIEVKDTDGNPVRAFKSSALGQFASATPLRNGTYTIVFEDPSGANQFDTVEITADGSLLSPIEIISNDQREELRKALFQPLS